MDDLEETAEVRRSKTEQEGSGDLHDVDGNRAGKNGHAALTVKSSFFNIAADHAQYSPEPTPDFGKRRAEDLMSQVVVSMKTIDLRAAQLQPVTGEHVKTLQALLNLFLTAGDGGEDGSPILTLTLDGTAGAKTKQAALAFQTAAHLATDAIVGPLTWKKLVEQDW